MNPTLQSGERVHTPLGDGVIVFVFWNESLNACQYHVRLDNGKTWWFNADKLVLASPEGQPT